MTFISLHLGLSRGGLVSKEARIGEYKLELEISGLHKPRKVSIVQTLGRGAVRLEMEAGTHQVTLLKVTSSEIEFILDKKYYRVKVVQSESREVRLLIHTTLISIRKNPSIQEILRSSLSKDQRTEGGDKDVKSQIPGRVVSIVAQGGVGFEGGGSFFLFGGNEIE